MHVCLCSSRTGTGNLAVLPLILLPGSYFGAGKEQTWTGRKQTQAHQAHHLDLFLLSPLLLQTALPCKAFSWSSQPVDP